MADFRTIKEEARLNTSRIDPQGKALGDQTMRLYVAPGLALAAAEGEPDQRCGTCAFRPGTVPAGCVQTQMDAFKCIMEDVPFMCHAHADAQGRPDRVCHGWFVARLVTDGRVTKAPWPFSDAVTAEYNTPEAPHAG